MSTGFGIHIDDYDLIVANFAFFFSTKVVIPVLHDQEIPLS